MKILTAADFLVSEWSGGTTTQLAIFPENATLSERNFEWRISSAQVETEESDFTIFHGYERILIPLKGNLEMEHQTSNGLIQQNVSEFELARFSGSWPTKGKGKLTDFNLIFKPHYHPKIQITRFPEETIFNLDEKSSVIVLLEGSLQIGDQLIQATGLLVNTAHETLEITCFSGTQLIFIEMHLEG